jgi:hypothetical protein
MKKLLLSLLGLSFACVVYADDLENKPAHRLWFTLENRVVDTALCEEKNVCRPVPKYETRLGEVTTPDGLAETASALTQLAKLRGYEDNHPQTPMTCQNVEAAKVLGFDPELWPMSEKLDPLIGLQGVFFALETLKAPEDYHGPFGEAVHAEVVRKFTNAGIPVLTEEQRDLTPGKPHLNIYFSNTNPDTGCWFSVFSSLSQTALLTRNHTVKIKAGTWGFGGGYSADTPDRSEYDAIMIVIDKFIADFQTANPEGIIPLDYDALMANLSTLPE